MTDAIRQFLDSLPVDPAYLTLEELVHKLAGPDSLAQTQLDQLNEEHLEDASENMLLAAGAFFLGLAVGLLVGL